MYREIIKAENEEYLLHIPKEYLGTQVEILVLPFDTALLNKKQEVSPIKDILTQSSGILASRNIDPIKWQNDIRNEWSL